MPRCIPAGQITLHLFSYRKRLPSTTTVTRGVVLNNPFGLFFATFFGGLCLRLQLTHMPRLNPGDDYPPHTDVPEGSDTNVLP